MARRQEPTPTPAPGNYGAFPGMGGDQAVNDIISFLNSGATLSNNPGAAVPAPPNPNPGIGGSVGGSYGQEFLWSPSDLPNRPVEEPMLIPTGGYTGGANTQGGAQSTSAYNLAFNEGFQFGYSAAQGADLPPLSQTPGKNPAFDSAFQAGYNAGYGAGGGTYTNPDEAYVAPEVPFGSSATGINATEAASLWESNPKLAIAFSGAAQPGTPGYNTLSDIQFHPQDILMAAGVPTTDPVARLQSAMNLYTTMGSKGGAMVDASKLLTNMAYAGPNTEFGEAVAVNPEQFHAVGMGVLNAAGASPAAINMFNEQMIRMYSEYGSYLLTTGADAAKLPFNTWLVQIHPEVVASWSS